LGRDKSRILTAFYTKETKETKNFDLRLQCSTGEPLMY